MDPLIELLKQYGWVGIVLIIMVILLTNNAATSFFGKLLDISSKSKTIQKEIQSGQFTVLRMSRTRPERVVTGSSIVISMICDIILLGSFGYIVYSIVTHPVEGGINSQVILFLGFLFVLPIIQIVDNVYPVKSKLSLELKCEPDILFNYCLRALFDINASISDFDAEKYDINARLNANDIVINISKDKNEKTNFVLDAKGRILLTFLYATDYRRNIDKLIQGMSYPIIKTPK